MKNISLNGEWQLSYSKIGNPEAKWGRWIPATVPGDVHLDLMRAGLICEPLISNNSTKYHWIEGQDWWYRRRFDVPVDFIAEREELVCDGLDLTADIWLNGEKVGSANNMFIQHRFEIADNLQPGENEILVRLDVGFASLPEDLPTDKFAKSWGREEPRRPWLRKAQQAFYWDVAPRLITCGIWRDITIESFDQAILRDAYVTSTVAGEQAVVKVQAEVEALAAGEYKLAIHFGEGAATQTESYTASLEAGIHQVEVSLNVEDPQLWWPNGMGEQYLYPVEIILSDPNGEQTFGTKSIKHGIRTIEIIQEELPEDESTFTFVVNGYKMYAKGGNWVPSDAIYARINRAKEYRLLKYAQEANFNMMRVWGGGVYPDSFFYEICDELGILVWQDFMYACAYYPDDEPEFCEAARVEAEKVVRKFRNHAALAIWCGNNENYMMHARVDPNGVFYGLKIYSEILPAVTERLDPKTEYIPSDPYPGPWPGQERRGTQHIWSYVLGWHDVTVKSNCDFSPDEMATVMQIWNIPELDHKFVSEFGIFCPTNKASMQKFMGEHPIEVGSPVYQHHRNHFEADFILEMLRRYYKKRDEYSLDEFIIAGQMSQAEALKYIFEEFRGRMYVCSGTLFWEYNDTWGHIGYSPVDYYLNVKPLYFYMRRAFAPLHVVFKEQGNTIYLLNDTPNVQSVEIEFGCQTFHGELIFQERENVIVSACSKAPVANIQAALNAVPDRSRAFVFARVYDTEGRLIDRNRQFLVPVQDLNMPADTMVCETTQLDPQTWQVDLAAEEFVWMVKIDADENLDCSDNAFDLWPGERKTVQVRTEKIYPYLELRVENINQYINR